MNYYKNDYSLKGFNPENDMIIEALECIFDEREIITKNNNETFVALVNKKD